MRDCGSTRATEVSFQIADDRGETGKTIKINKSRGVERRELLDAKRLRETETEGCQGL